jgi:hypothetical protein
VSGQLVSVNGTAGEHDPLIIEGIVEAKNERGIRINGDWYNNSQFRPVTLPEQGVMVRLEVRPNGFIKTLEVIKSVSESSTSAVLSHKDQRITRLAVLKAAAEFVGRYAQMREDVKSEHVLVLADRWLEWVEK